jgi:hypothetical protein
LATTFEDAVLSSNTLSLENLGMMPEPDPTLRYELDQVLRGLERVFGRAFAVIDCATGRMFRATSGGLTTDQYSRLASLNEIAQRGRPEIVEECSPLYLLAVPLISSATDPAIVATAMFVSDRVDSEEEVAAAAREFGLDPRQTFLWAKAQTPWHPNAVRETSLAIAEKGALVETTIQLKHQLADLSSHLLSTFEEITLLHRLTEHLSLSGSVAALCDRSVTWLSEVIPAKCVAIWLTSH